MSNRLAVNIAGVSLTNPIVTASGTFNSGKEYSRFVDLNQIGAITVKGISHAPWEGNPSPRTAETYGGMLNAVGLQNPGAAAFIKEDLPFMRQFSSKIIVNINGKTLEEYIAVAQDFANVNIDLIELNVSCPNVKEGGMAFGTDPQQIRAVTAAVKQHITAPLIVKLSPNVTKITDMAAAAEEGGADAISLINTIQGMAIDIHKRQPILGFKYGGLSGPAIKPVALRMVHQVAQVVQVPIIGMGGITTGEDAIEFIMAGATAVGVGTANFINPRATMCILKGINAFMDQYNIQHISDIRGVVA